MRAGREWDEADRQLWWNAYYEWLEPHLFHPGRFALIPDSPGAPSQINDGLLNDWPFGHRGAPVWHMDGPIERLARLCERYPLVAIGWIGHPKLAPVGCEAWFRRMDEVAQLMGGAWHPLHMLRGILVAREYPFVKADATTLAQNGHRYDWQDGQHDAFDPARRWKGRNAYADRLEQGHFAARVRATLSANRAAARRSRSAPLIGRVGYEPALQLGIL